MPRITALRPGRGERVRVELDGAAWRTLPTGAIVAAGLSVGSELDRVRARELARALRRSRALTAASAALSRRDRSSAGLEAYLGARGIASADRVQAVETLERLGYVDDARFAADRAAQLARRGFGDEGIRCRLEQEGLGSEQVDAALAALAPEAERAHDLVAGGDVTPKLARRLAAKGFSAEAIEAALGAAWL